MSPVLALSKDKVERLMIDEGWHDDLLAKYGEFGFCYEHDDIPLAPVLIDQSFLGRMSQLLRQLMLFARELTQNELSGRAPIRQDHRAIIELYSTAERQPMIGRPDCILADGTLKVLELNIDSGLGGIQEIHELVAGYRRSKLDALLPTGIQSPFDSQIDFVGDQVSRTSKKSVCIVPLADFNRLYLDQSDHLAVEIGRRFDVAAKTVFPEALRGGDWLTDGQQDYGIFYRDACFVHETIMLSGMDQALKAASTTKTTVLSDPLDIGVECKGALALVSEFLDTHPDAPPDLAALRSIVPWTRLLDRVETVSDGEVVNLGDHLRAHKSRLVLKRCSSHVGEQVFVGSNTDDAIWDDIISRSKLGHSVGEDWVAQEFVPAEKLSLWFRTEDGEIVRRAAGGTISPFIFGDQPDGWLVRIQGHRTANDAVLALPTDGNMGVTTVAAVQSGLMR